MTNNYITAVLAPALEQFRSARTLPNVFDRFGLDRSADDATIRATTSAVVSEWQKQKNNAKYAELVTALLADKERALGILLNPRQREEERRALVAQVQAERGKLAADIQRVSINGYVPRTKLVAIEEKWKGTFSRSDIRAQCADLRLPMQETMRHLTGVATRAEIAGVTYDEIKKQLVLLDEPSLFSFLKVRFDALPAQVESALRDTKNRWAAATVDQRKTAAQAVLRLAPDALKGGYRASYIWDLAETLGKSMALWEMDGVISTTEVRALPEWTRANGFRDVDPTLLQRVLLAVAADRHLTVELKPKGGAAVPVMPMPAPASGAPVPQWAEPATRQTQTKTQAGTPLVHNPFRGRGPGFRISGATLLAFMRGYWSNMSSPMDLLGRLFGALFMFFVLMGVLVLATKIAVWAAIGWGFVWLAANAVAAMHLSRWISTMTSDHDIERALSAGALSYNDAFAHPQIAPILPQPVPFVVQAALFAMMGTAVMHFVWALAVPAHSLVGGVLTNLLTITAGAAAWGRWSLSNFTFTRTLPLVAKIYSSRLRSLNVTSDS